MGSSIAEITAYAMRQVHGNADTSTSSDSPGNALDRQVCATLLTLLDKIRERAHAGRLNSSVTLKTLESSSSVNCLDSSLRASLISSTRQRIGVFPLAANPVHWGHIISSLFAVIEFSLDMMVLLSPGKIDYKPVSDRHKVSADHRHAMLQVAISIFDPLLRYTNVSLGTAKAGESAVHDLRRLNGNQALDFVLVWGAESEARVRRIMSQAAESVLSQPGLGPEGRHSLSLAFLEIVGTERIHCLTRSRISTIREEVGLSIPSYFAEVNLPFLTSLSSTHYRDRLDASLVPRNVHEYVVRHALYI